MRLILVLSATVAIAVASYGQAASPGYGAQPPVAAPYGQQGPVYQNPAPYQFFYGGSSSGSSSRSSSSSSSSESSSGSSECVECKECPVHPTPTPPTEVTCVDELKKSAEDCPSIYDNFNCQPPRTMMSNQMLTVVCEPVNQNVPIFIYGNGNATVSLRDHGEGSKVIVVTCHSGNVWTYTENGEQTFFNHLWCVSPQTVS